MRFLWETTANLKQTLYRVTLEQLKTMGIFRLDRWWCRAWREFILNNAQYTTNIDI